MNVTFNPYVSNYQPNISTSKMRTNNVQFTANPGAEALSECVKNLDLSKIMELIKNKFRLISEEKVDTVLNLFIKRIQDLTTENSSLNTKLEKANEQIAQNSNLSTNYNEAQKQIKELWSKIKGLQNELENTRAENEQLKSTFSIKPISDIEVIMPDKAIEIIRQMGENRVSANESMANLLMNGDGGEKAFEQIHRNNELLKAQSDGILNIQLVDKEFQKAKNDDHVSIYDTQYFILNLMEKALKGDYSRSPNLKSNKIREQVKANAMAILKQTVNENNDIKVELNRINDSVDSMLDRVVKFHDNLAKQLEKIEIESKSKEFKYVIHSIPFDSDESFVECTLANRMTKKQYFDFLANL